ncbi:MAG: hypothetical protein JWN17_3047 [Frankiales bacterium]|nr:hypothetical protein [Frankiales bacterium]
MAQDDAVDPAGAPPGRTRQVLVALALVVLVVAAAAGAAAAEYRLRRPAVYGSSAVLLIDQEPALSQAASDGVFLKLSRLRAKYVGLVRTAAFADPVAQQAGLSSAAVQSALSATADPTSLLLTLTARGSRADQARELAQVAAEQLSRALALQQASVGIPTSSRVTLTVVTPAGPALHLAPDRRRAELLGLVVAVGLAVPGLLGVDVLRRRRR